MRVLFLTNMYPHALGGGFIHDQAVNLNSRNCNVRVIVPAPFSPALLGRFERWRRYAEIPACTVIDSVTVYYPRYLRLPGKWYHGLSCYAQYYGLRRILAWAMEAFKPDVIHAHAATAAGFVGLLASEKYHVPLVCSLRGSDINRYPYFDRLTMRMTKRVLEGADQVMSVSSALRDAACELARPRRDIKVVYNGCDTQLFDFRMEDRIKQRRALDISEADCVVAFVGALSAGKGVFELIESVAGLVETVPNIRLLLIGDGPDRELCEKIISARHLDSRILLLGSMPHQMVARYLSAADVLALPSHAEGLPNVVLEAMACRLPVVATNVGGIPEAVNDGESGILILKGTRAQLSEAIGKLEANRDMAHRMGEAGRAIVEERFSWRKNAQEIMQIYEEVTANRRGVA